jgi:hypothetical protein
MSGRMPKGSVASSEFSTSSLIAEKIALAGFEKPAISLFL